MALPSELEFGQLLIGGISFMLVAAVALLAFLVVYKRRIFQQQLHLRTTEANHQRQLLVAIIEAQEGERERIGQDLHDGIGSSIATVKLLVNRLVSQPGQIPPPELLALIEELMTHSVQDVRNVSHSLYPAVLARYGLAEAVQHLVDVTNETHTIPLELDLDYPHPLAFTQELALYRICQELVHNALKHAKGATCIHICLHRRHRRLRLSVEDDGCGFVAGPASAGVGLRSIDVRVQMLGASLARHSVPGAGTRMLVELDAPLLA